MDVLGIDACGKQGWIGVRLADGAYDAAFVDGGLDALIGRAGECDVVAIDMPLGLLETGWRVADIEARAYLEARRSSVFLTAPRAVWAENDYAAANAACLSITGKGLSRQTWGLAPKLLKAHARWAQDPDRVYEVHPEVSFQAMAGGTPLTHSKKSWRGQAVRRSLLDAAGIRLGDELGEADTVPADDVLDAAAAAWSAHRIGVGTAQHLPAAPERDADGRPVAIWY
jgi:predicted RNase H-like nuclease